MINDVYMPIAPEASDGKLPSTRNAGFAPEATEWNLPSSRKVAIICLILTETGLFSIFLAGYVFYLGKSLTGPTPRDVLELPILSTICLLSSSITIVLAERAFNRDRVGLFKLFWLATIVLAGLFLTMTVAEWRTLIYQKGLTISTNLFGTTFYSLVGLHASHVIVGMCLLLLVLIFSLGGFVTIMHRERLKMISWYWHFVDAVWIVVFTVVYVIGR
ncbi:MAG TPA: cytochrome c oxidase subunit 3 [Pyrinomonadaceae bacterium]|jgi:cytochrome c oxidase subunit 3/cytochrome o ubiquinol oxidase subunit 3|nr:cytochrome c oxidase subunit 3 [Pyrinomonadaceae bacterium]